MSRGSSFLLVPWQDNFIAALARLVSEVSSGMFNGGMFNAGMFNAAAGSPDNPGNPGNVVLVFPHSRPARYLREEFRNNPAFAKPMLLPRCLTVSELMGLVRADSERNRPRPIGLLDQVGLLHQVLEQLRRDAPSFSPLPALPLDDFGLFLPWGVRLASLLEDCWLQNREPESFQYLEDEVQPYAAVLLASLRAIQNAYSLALRANNWTTPGFDAITAARIMRDRGGEFGTDGPGCRESDHSRACQRVEQRVEQGAAPGPVHKSVHKLGLFSGKKIILAGFYQLDESAEVVFRRLWEDHGALVCLHSSPSLLDGVSHPACSEHSAWARRWGAGFELFNSPGFDGAVCKEPEIRIWEGYDLHSELEALRYELEQDSGARFEAERSKKTGETEKTGEPGETGESAAPRSTAVILPDTSLIMPTLHSLPDKDVNVSMGYPLEFSALARLFEIIMRLRENAREEGAPISPSNPFQHSPGHSRHSPDHSPHNFAGAQPEGRDAPLSQGAEDHLARDGKEQARPTDHSGKIHYYWKDLQELYRHPLLRFLQPDRSERLPGDSRTNNPADSLANNPAANMANNPERPLGSLLRELEKVLLAGQPYANPHDLLAKAVAGHAAGTGASLPLSVADISALETLHRTCLDNFRQLGSAAALAGALAGVTVLLREWGQGLWESFPIDAECLYRLLQKIIPDFAHSVLKDKVLPDKALFGLLRQLISQERVPFEGEPLGALQVIGFLESRLLSFKRVFILDATEDRLPGAPGYDPLLPEALRNEMGLSNSRRREGAAAHNFWRLLAGAEEAAILTRSTQNGSGLLDERKVRSRFVEELIWQAEQKKKALLAPSETLCRAGLHFKRDGPLRVVLGQAESIAESLAGMPKSPELLETLFTYLSGGGISATFLDSYLRCPFRFALERLCGLRPSEGINEDDDPAAVGQLIHDVLHEFFTPYLGKQFCRDRIEPGLLKNLFLERLENKKSEIYLPADSMLMLARTGPERLRRMLENGPSEAAILHLEHQLRAGLSLDFSRELAALSRPGADGSAPMRDAPGLAGLFAMLSDKVRDGRAVFNFYGVIDRVDRRGDEIFILDYKTGHIPDSKFKIWEDEGLWEAVRHWRPVLHGGAGSETDAAGEELFKSLAEGLDSLQMPLYLYLMRRNGIVPQNALWVELSESGREKPLFSPRLDEELRALAHDERIPDLLGFILRHMLLTPTFFPRETPACRWCSFSTLCKVNFQ